MEHTSGNRQHLSNSNGSADVFCDDIKFALNAVVQLIRLVSLLAHTLASREREQRYGATASVLCEYHTRHLTRLIRDHAC